MKKYIYKCKNFDKCENFVERTHRKVQPKGGYCCFGCKQEYQRLYSLDRKRRLSVLK